MALINEAFEFELQVGDGHDDIMQFQNLGVKSFGAMNLSLNDEFGEFILYGVLQSLKGKLKYVPWVIFYYNVRQGVPDFVVDVGYESDWIYGSITYD